ncbi:MAG: FtsW/RodA/SpoVE family cell cycle protein [Lachnospiraceae bacterium]|nr:FtsW/RodA/SpoVE family cell cycle protein [Lachnospiraceae bacterium]
MAELYIVISKYIITILMASYTYFSFKALSKKTEEEYDMFFYTQTFLIYAIYVIGIVIVYLNNKSDTTIILAGAQMIYLVVVLGIFPVIYPKINRMLLSNMCMLLAIGFIELGRLTYTRSIKQFIIIAFATMLTLIVPFLMSKFEIWKQLTWFYYFLGVGMLLSVLLLGIVLGRKSNGSYLMLTFGGISFQPSEFVKILFVFFLAGLFVKGTKFSNVVAAAIASGSFVLTLVASKDLGCALILFMVFSFMLYAASKSKIYLFLCAGGGIMGAYVGSIFFTHVQTRIQAWRDPWPIIDGGGYQVTQSLFAICSGKLTGTGLYNGMPETIPEAHTDFVFSAIAEEFGGIFAVLLILVCLNCFLGFVTVSTKQKDIFNKLIAFGLGIIYAVQVFLTIGGAIKLIPSTGVTLPLISYGGSSALSTLIMFAIIQGLSIVGTKDEQKEKNKRTRKDMTIEKKNNRRQTDRRRA